MSREIRDIDPCADCGNPANAKLVTFDGETAGLFCWACGRRNLARAAVTQPSGELPHTPARYCVRWGAHTFEHSAELASFAEALRLYRDTAGFYRQTRRVPCVIVLHAASAVPGSDGLTPEQRAELELEEYE